MSYIERALNWFYRFQTWSPTFSVATFNSSVANRARYSQRDNHLILIDLMVTVDVSSTSDYFGVSLPINNVYDVMPLAANFKDPADGGKTKPAMAVAEDDVIYLGRYDRTNLATGVEYVFRVFGLYEGV